MEAISTIIAALIVTKTDQIKKFWNVRITGLFI